MLNFLPFMVTVLRVYVCFQLKCLRHVKYLVNFGLTLPSCNVADFHHTHIHRFYASRTMKSYHDKTAKRKQRRAK